MKLFHYKQFQKYFVSTNKHLDYDTISNYKVILVLKLESRPTKNFSLIK